MRIPILRRSRRVLGAAGAVIAVAALVVGCGSTTAGGGTSPTTTGSPGGSAASTPSGGGSTAPTTTAASTGTTSPAAGDATHSGPVNVLYAGSLVDLMEKQLAPAFHTASGYTFTGFAGGSSALATQIKGEVRAADVFISASPSVNTTLEGSANGDWVSWYATFATSPLVLGYNPHSRFADALKTKPWYEVVTEPGFLLGRTDPKVDPKGKLAAQALTETATAKNLPALNAISTSTGNVFPEETLVGRLQAGQLDAGFFYNSEAVAAHIPTVALTGVNLKATYTVTVLNRAPHAAAAAAFVSFLLGPDGRKTLTADGFELTNPPKVTGTGVPAALQDVIPTT